MLSGARSDRHLQGKAIILHRFRLHLRLSWSRSCWRSWSSLAPFPVVQLLLRLEHLCSLVLTAAVYGRILSSQGAVLQCGFAATYLPGCARAQKACLWSTPPKIPSQKSDVQELYGDVDRTPLSRATTKSLPLSYVRTHPPGRLSAA